MRIGRMLLLIVLGLGVAGFGVCALCGGMIGLSTLGEAKRSSQDIAWFAFAMSALGAALAWLCWWGWRRVRRGPAATQAPGEGPPA